MKNLLILFGANGDLTQRKLMPALYHLAYESKLSPHFVIAAIGRRTDSTKDYHNIVLESIKTHARYPYDAKIWNFLKERLTYISMDFADVAQYCTLNDTLVSLEKSYHTDGLRTYYLAVAPENFPHIIDNLHSECMPAKSMPAPRVVIEKPFGRNLDSAIQLNEKLMTYFNENNIYRIDHYLGKEMLQNIMVIRFANAFFEPIWHNEYIEQVQISAHESLGVETRGAYYENSGAMRDMVQSHLLQLISLIAMEKPVTLSPEAIRDAKVEALRAISLPRKDTDFVKGQYSSYRQEKNVASQSLVETYVALKLMIDTPRWRGVPFYLRTGKRLAEKKIEIIIQFKNKHTDLYQDKASPNYLVIKIQPEEGIFFQFNAKKPGTDALITPVKMDFCQNCQIGINSPEAYERLLFDVVRGDQTLFARWDEIESSWQLIDHIFAQYQNKTPQFPNYQDFSYGPKEADVIFTNTNHHWIDLGDDNENN